MKDVYKRNNPERRRGNRLEMTKEEKIEIVRGLFPLFKKLMEDIFSLHESSVPSSRVWQHIQKKGYDRPTVTFYEGDFAKQWLSDVFAIGFDSPKSRNALYVFDHAYPLSRYWYRGRETHPKDPVWGSHYFLTNQAHIIIMELMNRKVTKADIQAIKKMIKVDISSYPYNDLIAKLRNDFQKVGGFGERVNRTRQHRPGVFYNVYGWRFEDKD